MNDTPTPNRRARRAEAATAPVAPAIVASAERAASERTVGDTIASGAPVATASVSADVVATPVTALPDDGTAVLPEPTLVAEPDRPQPIVTASPPLTGEPSALDVVQAEAARERIASGTATEADREGPHMAAAGQPMLTIEGSSARHEDIDRLYAPVDDRAPRDAAGVWRHDQLSVDDLGDQLSRLFWMNPDGFKEIVQRFGLVDVRYAGDAGSRPVDSSPATVTVIEIVGPAQGRRRAGMTFGPTPQRFLASALDEDALATLRADPVLAVGVSQLTVDEARKAFAG